MGSPNHDFYHCHSNLFQQQRKCNTGNQDTTNRSCIVCFRHSVYLGLVFFGMWHVIFISKCSISCHKPVLSDALIIGRAWTLFPHRRGLMLAPLLLLVGTAGRCFSPLLNVLTNHYFPRDNPRWSGGQHRFGSTSQSLRARSAPHQQHSHKPGISNSFLGHECPLHYTLLLHTLVRYRP